MKRTECAGFGGSEFVTAIGVLSLLLLLGLGLSKLLGLSGATALVPPGAFVAGFVLVLAGDNIIDFIRRRRTP